MAGSFLMAVTFQKQGQLKGSSTKKDGNLDFSKGAECHAFNFGVSSPFDAGTGQLTGRRVHQPITIVREVDSASPHIWQALCTNEVLTKVVFSFPQRTSDGQACPYHTIELTNATVSSVSRSHSPGPTSEAVTLTFEGALVNGLPHAKIPPQVVHIFGRLPREHK